MNELFGYTNLLTNEWTDGIAAKIIRDNVSENTDLKKWIVFDGPVDALWIENMNTVLDDNKVYKLLKIILIGFIFGMYTYMGG